MQIENYKMKTESLKNGPLDVGLRSLVFLKGLAGKDQTSKTKDLNLQFSLFTFHFSILFSVLLLLPAVCLLPSAARAQTIPDKMVASVTNGSRATPDLITYSDLVWQLALEPGTPFSERPTSANLKRALRLRQDQTLILQEARKLPSAETPEANAVRDKEVEQKEKELVQLFGSRVALEERLTRVGMSTEQLRLILRDRVMVEQYLDFRFRAFAVVTDREIQDRYNQKYTRQRNSGRIVPTLEQARAEIQSELMEEKIEADIGKFIEELREQPGTEIVILNPV